MLIVHDNSAIKTSNKRSNVHSELAMSQPVEWLIQCHGDGDHESQWFLAVVGQRAETPYGQTDNDLAQSECSRTNGRKSNDDSSTRSNDRKTCNRHYFDSGWSRNDIDDASGATLWTTNNGKAVAELQLTYGGTATK